MNTLTFHQDQAGNGSILAKTKVFFTLDRGRKKGREKEGMERIF
jgi:hypothetical protein